MTQAALFRVFLLNATVLLTHQIDAAYWHEWDMFRIPGGNQLNLLLNVPIIALVLAAFAEVARDGVRARQAHGLLIFLGLLTVTLHSVFFALGHEQFLQPMSLVLLVGTGLLSVLQWTLLWRAR